MWIILLSLIGGSLYYFYAFGPKMLDEMVTEFVDDTVDAQIQQLNLPVDSFRVSFDEQELILYNYDLLEHAYAGKRLEKLQAAGFSVVLDSVFVSGINWEKLYLDSVLLVTKISAISSEIHAPKWIIDSLKIPSFAQIKSCSITSLELELLQVKVSGENGLRLSSLADISAIAINADSIYFDQSISIKSWVANTRRIRTSSLDGIHRFTIDGSSVNNNIVSFFGLTLKSLYTPQNLAENTQGENTIFDINIETLRLGIDDVLALVKDNTLKLNKLRVNNLRAKIYSDLGIARQSKRKMIQRFIRDIPVSVSIKHVDITNSSIIFQLRKPGFADNTLEFSSLKAELLNFTNISNELKEASSLSINLTAELNGHVPMSLEADFKMKDPLESYSYKGHLGTMNLTELSPILEAMKDMKITEGKLLSLDWDVKANSTTASGWLDFKYNELKMAQNNKNGIKDMDLLKFVATKLLVSSNNLPGQYFVRGNVSASRSPNRSMFFHMWESLFSGIESTLKP